MIKLKFYKITITIEITITITIEKLGCEKKSMDRDAIETYYEQSYRFSRKAKIIRILKNVNIR